MTASPPPAPVRLMVATPIYDGAQADYLRAVIGLTRLAEQRGLACSFAFLSNNASINRARNMLAGAFLGSDATHMLFLDGDIGFIPEQVLDLLELVRSDERLAVIGAPYPKRAINWQLVAAAAARGLGQPNPAQLERYSGVFAMDMLDPAAGLRLDQPLELKRLGTGLMLIRREVIETLCERHPELRYPVDPQDRGENGLGDHIFALFQPMFDAETGYLLSDDYAFCHRARDAGFRIWAAPWMRTSHTGPARFAAALSDLAALSS
ncbi:MAG: hypothetical protein NBV68_04270 [Erythrobacter sp.]|uniref:hypothetical protein n=1 Tax=Erythrobacter sp. TaxID=1042 RepID=UPI0025F99F7A|nr:hypothetical protein [Erythrobacter sp.]MCL9998573.1 hypothetical protein [Erythrobacter sp.]